MGFNLGGVFKSLVNPATLLQLAAGPAGWASLAMRTISTAIAQQVIQQLGQQLGLPPAVVNLAQQAFSTASGGGEFKPLSIAQAVSEIAGQFNLSPRQEGQLQQAADQSLANMTKIIDGMLKRGINGGQEEAEGGSILMRIATKLGALMDDKMRDLANKADALGRVGTEQGNVFTKGQQEGGLTAKGQGEFGKLSAQVQALSQELGYLSQAISSAIKGVGEAASTVARK